MIELHALAARDGWAYVKAEEEYWLIRPPYNKQEWHKLPGEWTIAEAVTKHGFTATDSISFKNDQDLYTYLRKHLIDASPNLLSSEEILKLHWETASEDCIIHAITHGIERLENNSNATRQMLNHIITYSQILDSLPLLRARVDGLLVSLNG